MIPTNTSFQQGVSAVSGPQFNSFTQNCNTAAQLRSFIGLPTMYVLLGGTSVVGDGNGGIFYWNASATATDDNLNVIVPYGSNTGAWLRMGTSAIVGASPIRTVTADTIMAASDGILEVNATAGAVMVTVPTTLGVGSGAQMRLIEKIDTTSNQVFISTDGVNLIDQILAPAGTLGQINGYRWAYINAAAVGGPALRTFGIG